MSAAPSLPPRARRNAAPRPRVLFVDDEPCVVGVSLRVLRACGYDAEGVTSGRAALERFRAAPEAFDVVITDQHMPGLHGDALARALLELRPRLPVILCSGAADAGTRQIAEAAGVREFLPKPLTLDQLASAVARALREPRSVERLPAS